MTTARIVRFYMTGGPEVLKIEAVDVPEPGPGDVRIRSRALGLNRAESMFRSGAYVVEPHYPAKIGYEVAGIVDAVGPDVETVAVGDQVSLLPLSPLTEYAVHGELAIAPARLIVKHPENLTFDEAAAAWMQYLTAYGALVEIAQVSKGDWVVIPAASSSVGLAAVQIARRAGATPIALTRGASKISKLLDAGAEHVIATSQEDLVARINEITGGKGARVTFDPVGGKGLALLAEAASPEGLIFVYGSLANEVTALPILPVLSKHLTIRGYDVFELANKPGRFALALEDITSGLADGSLKPIIDRVFEFDNFVEAHRYLESNQQFGKIVVSV
ncbi:NADPH:quinone reductase [Rhizobium leguminosarum]|uniref:zinc-dependent alcohol dehydrogenase family protein n=1 Tax=Rhizobium TaxID=379 RepID=UPI00103270D5|nr:zinc-dependent alcohol dehydrogenase family protein [Rhizobium leguminosarum]TBF87477.1 NADPH:quinone reductase [Rhizobium leguminosarum]TBG06953.1 NADPH:quinone reductase [Rhizobium leguminosarum]TBG07824.1 NADPH:quinone reductase [Rhizobium leguminosarum]TBG29990.1 NADPH:quinone reductase [Rhizobium leguminosarum]TBG50123.1 NADPH:quinone reductase [Rhizobium leguminosarum]